MSDNKERVENIILTELAAEKSVLIDGVATISVCRVGSRKVNPKRAVDFPHLELVVSPPNGGLSLLSKVGEEDFNKWLASVRSVKGGYSIINIKDCFALKIKGETIVVLSIREELKMVLNPFATDKNDTKRGGKPILIMLVVCLLISISYFVFLRDKQPISKEQEVIVDENPQIIIDSATIALREQAVRDSIASLTPVDTVDYYIVVGSYPSKKNANIDSVRLSGIYGDMEIKSIRKRDGKTINYIYKGSNQKEAEERLATESVKYPIIKGMWIYEERK